MIFDFILNVVSFFLNRLALILPSYNLFPPTLATDIRVVMTYINSWSWMFPVDILMTIIAAIILLVFVEFTYFAAMFVFSIIHSSIK
jgi:hypothetical protein